nr:MAG TPA: hypothetical protein [Caudoviricetes sp.]
MFYPAPLPAAVTNFEQLAAEISAKCTPHACRRYGCTQRT